MNKLTFASDIDGCVLLINNFLIDYLAEKYDKHIEYNDIKDYNIENLIEGVTGDDILEAFYKIINENVLDIEEGAKEVIKWTFPKSERGEIIFITSRNPELEANTYENVNMYFDDIDYIIFFEKESIRKSDYINKYGINLFVEDNVDTALDIVANTNCRVLLLDRPWNKHLQTRTFENLERVSNWVEIKEYIIENYNT